VSAPIAPGGDPRPARWERPAAALLLLAAFVAFTRPIWASGGDTIPGHDDALLNLYTMEQWYRWLALSQGSWLGGGFFYPLANTLGLTDAMFLMALPLAALRAAGLDPFTAYQCLLYGAAAAAAGLFYFLLRRELGLGTLPSAIGTVPAAFSNAMFMSVGHPQLFSYVFVPLLAILLCRFARAGSEGRRSAVAYGIGAAVVMSLLFFTGFYIAWFFALFLLVLALVCLPHPATWRGGRELLRGVGASRLAAMAVVFGLLLAPFLVAYLPVLQQTGGRAYRDLLFTLPQWIDYFNVSYDNLVWGRLLQQWFPQVVTRPIYWELFKGMGPIVLATFALSILVTLVVAARAWRGARGAVAPWVARLALAVALAVVACWLLILRLDEGSAWKYVHAWVPGAKAIRAVFRFNLVLAFGVGLAIAVALTALQGAPRRRGAVALLTLLGIAIVAEQVNLGRVHFLSKAQLRARVDGVPPAPAHCRSFFVVDPQRAPRAVHDDAEGTRANVVAMLIAIARQVPTLHGHSSGAPPGWALSGVDMSDYLYRVSEWVRANGITDGVCSLDIDAKRWTAVPVASLPRARPMTMALGPADFRFTGRLEPALTQMRPGETRSVALWVRNQGSVPWTSASSEADSRFAIRFAYQWVDASGAAAGFSNRWHIAGEARPGEEGRVDVSLTAPAAAGDYILEFDGVQEWVDFFRTRGNPTFRTAVVVR
jgi:hypothetical protein